MEETKRRKRDGLKQRQREAVAYRSGNKVSVCASKSTGHHQLRAASNKPSFRHNDIDGMSHYSK